MLWQTTDTLCDANLITDNCLRSVYFFGNGWVPLFLLHPGEHQLFCRQEREKLLSDYSLCPTQRAVRTYYWNLWTIDAYLPFSKRLIFRISRTIHIFCTKFINIINFLFYRLIWNRFWLFVILLWRMLFWRITAGLIAKKDSKLTRENILKLVRLALLATRCAALWCGRCRHSARWYPHHGTWSVESIGSWCQS